MNLQNLDTKENITQDFFEWLFDDSRIINKNIILKKEIDLTLAPFYKDANIYFPEQISKFFETNAMKRIGRVSHLSLVINDHPNAYHNRLEHCKGSYNRKLEEFIYNFQNSDWRKYIEENDLKLYLIADLIKIAGHDIGHFPLSHAFEEQIYNNHEAHEIFGKRIMLEDEEIRNVLKSICPELPNILEELYKKNIMNFKEHDESNYDVDRIDYLSRDSFYLGMPHNISTQSYERVKIKTDKLKKPLKDSDLHIIESESGIDTIDVYDYSSLKDIEDLLRLRYESYQNVYMFHNSKIAEVSIGIFLKAFLDSDSEYGRELRDFISHLKQTDINNVDISEFLKWDDIKLYSQIIEIAKNDNNPNLRALATMTIPNLKSFLNMLYSHLDVKNTKNYSDNDKRFLIEIKKIIQGHCELSNNLRNPNFTSENTLVSKANLTLPQDDIAKYISDFSYILHAYSLKAPIYIRDGNGKIYELSNHPDRSCNWDTEISNVHFQFLNIPYLKFIGISESEIEYLKKFFEHQNSLDVKENNNQPIFNMSPLKIEHQMKDIFLEL